MSASVHGRVVRGVIDRRVDLDIADGEVVAVMGPNGAGKSTLLRTLAGLHRLAEGTVAGDGAVWDDAGRTWVTPRRRGVGLVMQSANLFPRRTVEANVAFGPRSRGKRRRDASSTARDWLERVGAAHLADRRAESLSGGETQRVALARALAAEPNLLLLDEPLSAVDAESTPGLLATIREVLAGFGGAAVVVLHDGDLAGALADRIFHLEFTPGR